MLISQLGVFEIPFITLIEAGQETGTLALCDQSKITKFAPMALDSDTIKEKNSLISYVGSCLWIPLHR